MKYLFFDIECANCDGGAGKICSFGYVLTDTSFNVLEYDDIIINPKAPFKLKSYGKEQKFYIELAYSEEVFKASPAFPFHYPRIKHIMLSEDMVIFGFAPENDAGFLAAEFERYGLPNIDFEFCDVQRIYKRHVGYEGGNQFSLVRACEELGIAIPETVHKSVDDAMATMRVLKRICAEEGRGPVELTELYAPCTGELKNGELEVAYFKKKAALAPGEENLMKGINEDNFKKLIKRTKREGKGNIPQLRGKRICFSGAYEFNRYRQMCVLLPLIVAGGARITRKVKECNTYISCSVKKTDGRTAHCQRYKHVEQMIAEGRNVHIVRLSTLLSWLGLDEEKLDKLAFPDDGDASEVVKATDERIAEIVGTEVADEQETVSADTEERKSLSDAEAEEEA
ncbi:MAG: hypothetical protein IJY04_03185 [Clostridia bacterium]|nr:hypothetical protein [Clostridia bacterium]